MCQIWRYELKERLHSAHRLILPSSGDLGWAEWSFFFLRTLPSLRLLGWFSLLLPVRHSSSMGSSSTRIVGMFTFGAGETRPTSARLFFTKGLTAGGRLGLGRYWDEGSPAATGDDLFPVVPWCDLFSIILSAFESIPGSLEEEEEEEEDLKEDGRSVCFISTWWAS